MTLFTIGFTKKTAESFFETLKKAGVKRLIDVRLFNESQLAGFSKRADLQYFAKAICGIDYLHRPDLAPTPELFEAYKKKGGSWAAYEKAFLELTRSRKIDKTLDPDLLEGACLLCTEDWPDHCHRRLIAEYLEEKWGDLTIEHLV